MDTSRLKDMFNTLDNGVILQLILIVASATVLIMLAHRVLPWIANRLPGKPRLFVLAMVPLARLVVIIGAFLLIVPLIIEPSLQNMVALFGFLGLALGFALKDYASSLIAGIVAVGETPYRNGDWIDIAGYYGEVKHVGMRTVEIVTPDDTTVVVPHLTLWKNPVANANNGSPRQQCVADFYLQFDHDGEQVRTLLTDVALTSAYTCLQCPIAVVATNKPWGSHYRLKAYPVDARQQFRFLTDLSERGNAAVRGAGFGLVEMGVVGQAGA